MRAVVLDDDEITLEIVKSMAKEAGVECECYTSPSLTFVNDICNSPPDLFIIDVHLQGIEAEYVINFLKLNKTLKDIPVLAISSDDDLEGKIDYIRLGVVDFISKPFDKKSFLRSIKQCGLIGKLFKAYNKVEDYVDVHIKF